jgi:hypothetical protein
MELPCIGTWELYPSWGFFCKRQTKWVGILFYFKQVSARWPGTGKLDGIEQHKYPAALETYRPAPQVGIPGQVQLLDWDLNVV